jgi:hypothetical protein
MTPTTTSSQLAFARSCFLALILMICLGADVSSSTAAEVSAAADPGEKRRAEIPLGGDFNPNPKEPAFVVVGHGGRIIVSRDDGKSWTQTFFGYPSGDHGGWATRTCTYEGGVFVVSVGWGAPCSYLASEDGVHWRHLTAGTTKLAEGKGDPRVMTGTWGLAGGKGTIVATGYMTMAATSDFGKTFSSFSMWGAFKNDPRGKLNTHHLDPVYCGEKSGRFLALGDNRGADGEKFGHLFASDDLGKTWRWLAPKGLEACTGRGAMVSNGKLLVMTDTESAHAWTSADAGETWSGPHPTGTKRAVLSEVRGEFWLAGKPSRASADGKTWRDLPSSVPVGQVIASNQGTLISTHPQRTNILRSADEGESWQEVHRYQPEAVRGGAQGLRDGVFGFLSPR